MCSIKKHPNLKLQIVAMSSATLDRYGNVSRLIEGNGFSITESLFTQVEGGTPSAMAKSTGLALIELSSVFSRLMPDLVLTVGDRYETMATTLAAAYMNILLAHTMGGEVSGTIDESIRHAITKFSHVHFPASADAASRIIRMGENPNHVHTVGCPRIDLVKELLAHPVDNTFSLIANDGVGATLDLRREFLLVSQHPVTTEHSDSEEQITQTLQAVYASGIQAIILWPNSDAGSEGISRGIRKWREIYTDSKMRFFKNLPIANYVYLMQHTACLVGNSSSGIREGAFIGTPCVNIGSRQSGRERGSNVIDVPPKAPSILAAIQKQTQSGPYPSDHIYGSGDAGERIAQILYKYKGHPVQKMIIY
jgi:UDP-hydrolysing UDP-N-acetyl-D-glucosamine 2-epimerase